MKIKDPKSQIEQNDHLKNLYHNHQDTLYSLLKSMFIRGDYGLLLSTISNIIDIGLITNTKLLNLIALTYIETNEHDLGEQILKTAIKIAPKNAYLCFNLGKLYLDNDQMSKAVDTFNEFTGTGNLSIEEAKLEALIRSSRYKEANYVCNSILKNFKLSSAAHIGRAKCLVALKNDKATALITGKQHIQFALEIEPFNNQASLTLSAIELLLGKPEQGLQILLASYEHTNNDEILLEIVRLISQLHDTYISEQITIFVKERVLKLGLTNEPRLYIYLAIFLWRRCEYQDSITCLTNFLQLLEKDNLAFESTEVKVFCMGYFKFLFAMAQKNRLAIHSNFPVLYHIGESHSLSFHGQLVKINDKSFEIKSLLTIGAKAYAFSDLNPNNYKAVTLANISSIPRGASALISFGEIDCRLDGGILSAATKMQTSIGMLTSATVKKYVDWFLDVTKDAGITPCFINVPAPRKRKNKKETQALIKIVRLFNHELRSYCQLKNVVNIDLYTHTKDQNGLSNEIHHIDNIHLGASIVPFLGMELSRALDHQ